MVGSAMNTLAAGSSRRTNAPLPDSISNTSVDEGMISAESAAGSRIKVSESATRISAGSLTAGRIRRATDRTMARLR
ncbi:MAG: hypothetical protein ACE5JZ_05145 [Kiloniellales bacterium]